MSYSFHLNLKWAIYFEVTTIFPAYFVLKNTVLIRFVTKNQKYILIDSFLVKTPRKTLVKY